MWKWKESPFSEYTPWKTKDKDKKIENEERKWKACSHEEGKKKVLKNKTSVVGRQRK